MQFSKELLADIHIRLDREGLQGLDEKEISVLLSEQLEDTTQQITDKMGNLSKQLDKSTEQICVEIGQSTLQIGDKIMQMGDKIDQSTAQIITQMGGKIDQSTAQVCEKIDEAVSPIHQELARFHSWAKLLVVGVWAVVASLIASLIFKACGGG